MKAEGGNVAHLQTSESMLRAIDLGDQRWEPVFERVKQELRSARATFNRRGRAGAVVMSLGGACALSPVQMPSIMIFLPMLAGLFMVMAAASSASRAFSDLSVRFKLPDEHHGTSALRLSRLVKRKG